MSSENQFLVTISDIPGAGFWATKTGGDVSTPITKDFDGGSDEPDVSYGRDVWSDLVIGRRYDVARDGELHLALLRQNRTQRTVTVQPCDAAYNPTGPALTYRVGQTGVSTPAVNANGSAPARFQVTFAVLGLAS